MKKCFGFLLLLISFSSFGNSEIMTVKERLRLSLWFEGLDSDIKKTIPEQVVLPEELEVTLKKN